MKAAVFSRFSADKGSWLRLDVADSAFAYTSVQVDASIGFDEEKVHFCMEVFIS